MPFYAPNFGKVGRACCLWLICLCLCVGGVFVDWGVCQGLWLAGSVGHFFETLNGECLYFK